MNEAAKENFMSDHIAHLGICDDTFRLALLHPQIHDTFKQVMTRHRDVAHMGCVTRSADNWSVELIVEARQQMQNGDSDPLAPQKLAFVLGALTHPAKPHRWSSPLNLFQ